MGGCDPAGYVTSHLGWKPFLVQCVKWKLKIYTDHLFSCKNLFVEISVGLQKKKIVLFSYKILMLLPFGSVVTSEQKIGTFYTQKVTNSVRNLLF